MLQRAASNAYSWWWASHIRTKQSKWMEQNLQDMEEKVHEVLKLLHEEGDSFAKRAEMYYKKRPELIIFVEESFKAYRAMAERYDHLSKELQNANTTIASVCPDRVPFPMDDDAEGAPPGYNKQKPKPLVKGNIPSVPKTSGKDLKGMVSIARKKLQPKKPLKTASTALHPKSGLSKGEAVEEIDKLQKDILTLQTEKEFVKSSYESGLAKYWDIEKFIKEKQDRICGLQDEFGTSMVIEDEEARRLMASAALKSCEDKLSQLQETQEKTVKDARVERRRIRESREKLDFLKDAYLGNEASQETPSPQIKPIKPEEEEETNEEKVKESDSSRDKTKERADVRVNAALDVTDMAEKIDELVGKVISLETSVSSQTALIQSLRTETSDLQGHIRTLEDDKSTLMDDKKDMSIKLKEMEEKLLSMQDLNRRVEEQSNNLQTQYSEASGNLGHDADKQDIVKADKEREIKSSSTPEEKSSPVDAKSQEDLEKSERTIDLKDGSEKLQNAKGNEDGGMISDSAKKSKDTFEVLDEQRVKASGFEAEKTKDVKVKKPKGQDVFVTSDVGPSPETDVSESLKQTEMDDKIQSKEAQEQTAQTDDEPDWKKLFMNGMENKEKILLTEYTTLLRSCKEFKNKLSEEKLKMSNSDALKDAEIHELRQKLKLLQAAAAAAAHHPPENRSTEEVARTASVDEDDFCAMLTNPPQTISPIEEEFRMDIDELLEENLDFWLRFSTSFHQIQKFDSGVEDLLADLVKVEERKRSDGGSSTAKYAMISDIRPMYRHFRDIHTELTVWLDKSMSLKEELKSRFSSLCNIQDEITKALKASAEDYDFAFTSYQAAKFQGEILNMKQENNKVADELQAGLDHITALHVEVEKTLTRLSEDYELTGSKNSSINQITSSDNSSRVPLRSFIFGVKQKKQKQSIFSMYKKVRNI